MEEQQLIDSDATTCISESDQDVPDSEDSQPVSMVVEAGERVVVHSELLSILRDLEYYKERDAKWQCCVQDYEVLMEKMLEDRSDIPKCELLAVRRVSFPTDDKPHAATMHLEKLRGLYEHLLPRQPGRQQANRGMAKRQEGRVHP